MKSITGCFFTCKWLLLSGVFIMLLSQDVKSQYFTGGISGGLTATEISGDKASGPDKIGLFAGLSVSRALSDYSYWQLGLEYIQKGSRAFNDPETSGQGSFRDYRLNLGYMEVPLSYHIKLAAWIDVPYLDQLGLEAGLSLATWLHHREWNDGLDISAQERERKPFNRLEMNGLLGLSYPLGDRYSIHLRIIQGLTPVRPHGTEGGDSFYWWNWHNQFGQYNTAWTFGLSYRIPFSTGRN